MLSTSSAVVRGARTIGPASSAMRRSGRRGTSPVASSEPDTPNPVPAPPAACACELSLGCAIGTTLGTIVGVGSAAGAALFTGVALCPPPEFSVGWGGTRTN